MYREPSSLLRLIPAQLLQQWCPALSCTTVSLNLETEVHVISVKLLFCQTINTAAATLHQGKSSNFLVSILRCTLTLDSA